MNIAEAKEQVYNTIKAYSTRDENGNYVLESDQQRPLFLMGPPGIGKTAIVRQVAEELGLGLVSYSITHHTRQSALGLPKIVHKRFGNDEYDVSEYTMSEIISSVYDCMEDTGLREGILFLDEVNCASETLTPTMLQFLQFKTFGRHKVPDGWIVVTAGNPIAYNRSAREFDIVTWDRLKKVDIKPDYDAWKAYAYKHGAHAAILTYLDIRKEYFYKIEETVDGKNFVTARGWIDLSDIIKLYEQRGIGVDRKLIEQYIQNPVISEDFATYYDLYNKYKSDYQIEEILSGRAPQEIEKRAQAAEFDERLSLLGLLMDSVNAGLSSVMKQEDIVTELLKVLKEVKSGKDIRQATSEEETLYHRFRKMGVLSSDNRDRYEAVLGFLNRHITSQSDFQTVKADYDAMVEKMKSEAGTAGTRLGNLFCFIEKVFGDGQEMLILVTELTMGYYSSRFIARYGCDEYYKYNDSLKFYERRIEILKKGEALWQQSTM
ncbi:MAG: MoxR family ATPase [Lachnospiraceae bacterium]|nr:MoxR family ATPase [Lachnospiraceae bacterium]